MNTVTYYEFMNSYSKCNEEVPSVRLGQYFINHFIKKEDNTTDYSKLWNEEDDQLAHILITALVEQLQWDFDKLVLVRGDKLYENS